MRLHHLLIVTFSLLLAFKSVSFAALSGSLGWDYGHYMAEESGVRVTDASHFAQRYSLLFSRSGVFMGGRGGQYNIALGGEWWGLNNKHLDAGVKTKSKISSGKFLYRGDLTFAPGGLPFRLHIYAHDMSASTFIRDRFFTRGSFDELYLSPSLKNILTPGIINDVNNGTRQEYGMSMVLGIKNGSYLGRYRNVLSHLPKLYIDFRELNTKDLDSRTPEYYRDRELAFVSLNKKHNWFHYRFFDHFDKLNSVNNFGREMVMLGTVDQNLRREWVNLTNWIQLSTDGSYVQWDNRSRSQTIEQDYIINLFVKTERQNWQSALLSNYSRYERAGQLQRNLFVPFFSNGSPDRNNSWRLRLIGSRELMNTPFDIVNVESARDSTYAKFRWETNRTSQYISSPEMEIEGKFGDRGKGSAARLSYEYYSNKGLLNANPYDLFSRITVAYFRGTPHGSIVGPLNADVNLFEMTGRFDLAKQLSQRFRTGFGSLLLLGSGEAEVSPTDYIRPLSLERLKASQQNNALIDGTVWRIEALLFLEHISLSRITNRLETGLEYQDYQLDSEGQYYLRHRLGYSSFPYSVNVKNAFLYGDNLYRAVTSRAFGVSMGQQEFDGSAFSHESTLSYAPNREHLLSGTVLFDWLLPEDDSESGGNRLALSQDYRYTHYLRQGAVRRLLTMTQYLDYERFDNSTTIYEGLALTGLVDYYPTAWSRIAGKVKWQHSMHYDSSETGFGFYSDLNFSLLSVGLEYEYGMRSSDAIGAIRDRKEQRWNISIRKVF